MLKILFFLIIASLPLKASEVTDKKNVFVEGIHYKVLEEQQLQKNNVSYVYSVYCYACYAYEKSALEYIKKSLPKNVKWQELHFTGTGKFSNNPSKILESVPKNKKQEIKSTMYRIIHEEDVLMLSDFYDALIKETFLSRKDIDKIVSDEKIALKIEKQEEEGYKYAKITGIPAIIVNNKYILVLKKIQTLTEIKELIIFLLQKDNKKKA